MRFSSIVFVLLGVGVCVCVCFLLVVISFGTLSHEKLRDEDPVFLSLLKAFGMEVQNWRPATKPPAAAKDCLPPAII